MRRQRHGKIDLGKAAFLVAGLVAIYLAWAFIPPYYTKYKMNEVVQITLLDWRDFNNQERSLETLVIEMDNKEVPEYVWPEDCEFFTDSTDGSRHLDCYWAVEVKYPGLQKRTQLEFQVHKYLDSRDVLKTASD